MSWFEILIFFNITFIAINFSLSTTLVTFHKFWYVDFSFLFVPNYVLVSFVISSLTHWSCGSMLLDFHIFVNTLNFPVIFICDFIPLWLGNIIFMIFIFLNLLGLVLWPSLWFILENGSCELEKDVYSPVVKCNVL